MRRLPLAALALLAAAPAVAQPAASPVPVAPAPPTAPDPARLALARRLVDKVVPAGTMQRMMEGTMGALTGNLVSAMLPAAKQAELRQRDPAFDERMRRVLAVMTREMGGLMAELEPQMRAAAAAAYARRFDERQLADISAFFDTPSGAAYAAQSLTLATDPDMMRVSMGMLPRLMQRMPTIATEIKAATADLPPPPKPAGKP